MDLLPFSVLSERVTEAVAQDDDVKVMQLIKDSDGDRDLLNDALYYAAKLAKPRCLSTLISLGADVNYWNSAEDETVLGAACQGNHVEIVRAILTSSWANLNIKSRGNMRSVSHSCAQTGAIDCLHLIHKWRPNIDLNVKDCFGNTPLMLAAREGHDKMVQALLLCGAKPDVCNMRSQNAFSVAVDHEWPKCVKELLCAYPGFAHERNKSGLYPLTDAIRKKRTEMVRAFVDAGCDVNCPESTLLTPLHLAIEIGDVNLVRTLAQGGAHVSQSLPIPFQPTPLMVAVAKGQPEMVATLVDVGCDIDAFDSLGRTALYLATKFGYVQCVKVLLDLGADPDAYTLPEDDITIPAPTAIHSALLYDKEEEAILLVQAGCDVDFPALYTDHQARPVHYTPMALACERKMKWAIRLLLRGGSKCLDIVQDHGIEDDVIEDLVLSSLLLQSAPATLKQLCRTFIRRELCMPFSNKVSQLPLPGPLKSYLMYEELHY